MGCCSSSNAEEWEKEVVATLTREPNSNQPERVVPFTKTTCNTFIELILMKRILFNSIIDAQDDEDENLEDRKNETKTQSVVQDALNQLMADEMNIEKCQVILSNLEKRSISEYMSSYYHDSQCITIDLLFNKIIIKHYPNEYANEISSKFKFSQESLHSVNNYSVNKYQCQLFNQSDLVQTIFGYLDFKSVNHCSLVNFVWLFDAFNVNVSHQLLLSDLVKWEPSNNCNSNQQSHYQSNHNYKHPTAPFTVWQRFYNVRKIVYLNVVSFAKKRAFSNHTPSKQFWDNLECFENIEKFFYLSDDLLRGSDLMLFKTIAKHSNKIVELNTSLTNINPLTFGLSNIDTSEDETRNGILPTHKLALFELGVAKSIQLETVPIPFICSNKCKILSFNNIYLTDRMIKLMTNDCDLTGIETLKISKIYMNGSININNISIKSIGDKMTNLKRIVIRNPTPTIHRFCQSLKPTIVKNNCNINVRLGDNNTANFLNMIKSNQLGEYLSDIEIDVSKNERVLAKVLSSKNICWNVNVLRFKCPLQPKCIYTAITSLAIHRHPGNQQFVHFVECFKDYCSQQEIKFGQLSYIDCQFGLEDELDFVCLDNFLNLALTLTSCENLSVDSVSNSISKKEKVTFWRFNINVPWYDSVFGDIIDESRGSRSDAYDPNGIYAQPLQDTLAQIFDGIKSLFIQSQIPIDFTMNFKNKKQLPRSNLSKSKSKSRVLVAIDNDTTMYMKDFYQQYYKPSFESAFGHVDKTYKMPKSNEYCVACQHPKIFTKLTEETNSVCKVVFRVQTAVCRPELC